MANETQTPETPANFDKYTDAVEAIFRFNKDDLGNRRPPVEGKLPVPSVEGIQRILAVGGKQLELLQDCMYDAVRAAAAAKISENEAIKSISDLDLASLSWEALANVDKKDRRSNNIPAEKWAAFAKDYISVMPALTGKTVENVTNATIVYLKKFAPWKSDKVTLNLLKTQLAIYLEQPSAQDHLEVLEVLFRRLDSYLEQDSLQQVAQNL
jgi:hypothetical protein